MQNKNRVYAIENVLLKKNKVSLLKERNALQQDARRRAKEIIKAAEQDVYSYQNDALVTGYLHGILMSLEAVISYFKSSKSRQFVFYDKTMNELESMLSRLFTSRSVYIDVLNNWININRKSEENESVTLLIPNICRGLVPQLYGMLNQWTEHQVHVEYHDDMRFIIHYGDNVAEFCPENLVKNMLNTLLKNTSDLSLSSLTIDAKNVLKETLLSELQKDEDDE